METMTASMIVKVYDALREDVQDRVRAAISKNRTTFHRFVDMARASIK